MIHDRTTLEGTRCGCDLRCRKHARLPQQYANKMMTMPNSPALRLNNLLRVTFNLHRSPESPKL
jgi:hypothetical protein